MVVNVRKVLETMRAKTKAITAKVKPAVDEPIVISFRICGIILPQREPMRIPSGAARYCYFHDKKHGDQKPVYKESKRGRGRVTTHISF